jgi:uncharacterized membrane protein
MRIVLWIAAGAVTAFVVVVVVYVLIVGKQGIVQ